MIERLRKKKITGEKVVKDLETRIKYIEQDFTDIDYKSAQHSEIIRHIFNYFFPMSIKGAMSGMRVINMKFNPEYQFDREFKDKPTLSPQKAKIILSITEILCKLCKELFPNENYISIVKEFFDIEINLSNYEYSSITAIDNYISNIDSSYQKFSEKIIQQDVDNALDSFN